ncbi:MAG: hypothetical protein ACRC42_02455 [Mycoplasma sp.]
MKSSETALIIGFEVEEKVELMPIPCCPKRVRIVKAVAKRFPLEKVRFIFDYPLKKVERALIIGL